MTAGFENDVMLASNVNFNPGSPPNVGQVTTNAQLLIGSTAAPNIRVGNLTSTGGTIAATYVAPNINLEVANGAPLTKIKGNDGVTEVPDATGVFNFKTANATVKFLGSTNTETLDFGLTNLVLGGDATSITIANANSGFGLNALDNLTSGSDNCVFGWGGGGSITTGSSNCLLGVAAGGNITSGNSNCCIGSNSLQSASGISSQNTTLGGQTLSQATGGVRANLVLGFSSGMNYTTTESDNILLLNKGVISDNRTTRIGNNDAVNGQTRAFLSGVTGVTVAATAPIGVNSSDQLSSLGFGTANQIFTSNGAGASPTWQAPATFSRINVQDFTSSGTYTPTSGMKYCIIECIGGGGGGGSCGASATLSCASTGGGGGEYMKGVFSAATIGASKAVTVGSAGANGGVSGDGGNGGTSSVGVLISAAGGTGGKGSTTLVLSSTGKGTGGSGGASGIVAGQMKMLGGNGGASHWSNALGVSGYGGMAGGGSGSMSASVLVAAGTISGNSGSFPGGGGSGSVQITTNASAVGGAGSSGYVFIIEFI